MLSLQRNEMQTWDSTREMQELQWIRNAEYKARFVCYAINMQFMRRLRIKNKGLLRFMQRQWGRKEKGQRRNYDPKRN